MKAGFTFQHLGRLATTFDRGIYYTPVERETLN